MGAATSAVLGGALSMAELRQRLPVFKHRASVLHLIETHGVTVIVGHTGSGKTTRACR